MTTAEPLIALERRILLVEDEALIAMDLERRLERLGYSVTSIAKTADEAVRLAASHMPDLILMDIHLSGKRDGIEAAEEIRKILDIPVVFLTAHNDNDTVERARATGPFGYITKPFDKANLRIHIEIAISKHRTEKKLRQNEAWLSTTLRSIGDAVIATDIAGLVQFMNPVAEALTGWAEKAAIGEFAADVFTVLDPATAKPVANPVLSVLGAQGAGRSHGEYSLRSRAGSEVLVQTVVSANRNDEGRLLGSVIVFRDITGQRELELRNEQNHNMATVAVMAGGLAHDFNNLLMIILGYTALARSDPDNLADSLDHVRRAGDSAAALCRQLLTVSRNDSVQAEIFDLNEPIIAGARMLRQILGPPRSLVVNFCSGSLFIASERTQIQQVLINLAICARDSMPQGGILTIATRLAPDGWAELEVADTGIGMTAETRRRIFEPCFSGKTGKGIGFGMTIVHSIVSKWSGTIEVKSDPGRGTTFRIRIPLSPARGLLDYKSELQLESPEYSGSGNIFLVEDNEQIRRLLRARLEISGFQVFEALSGEDALLFPVIHGETIDLLITDVMMPGMSGPELAKRWLERSPETMVLFISGYSKEELGDNDFMKSGRAEFVAKPVTPSELISTVRKMLSRRVRH
jgi:PAS domain S-box-containing protein